MFIVSGSPVNLVILRSFTTMCATLLDYRHYMRPALCYGLPFFPALDQLLAYSKLHLISVCASPVLHSLFIQIRKSIGLDFVTGFCIAVAFLAAVARQIIIRSREHDNKGSVADLVRRGQLKSRQQGRYFATSLTLHFAFSCIHTKIWQRTEHSWLLFQHIIN
jgi:hypothetical protein